MLGNAFEGFRKYQTNLTAAGVATAGTLVTAGTPAHTKTASATQLIASTDFDAYMVGIGFSNVNTAATNTRALCDILIGGAGSETVLIPNLLAGYSESHVSPRFYWFPLYIPAGTRLSAKSQSVIALDTVDVLVFLLGNPRHVPDRVGASVTAYNIATATSGVTNAMDPGNAAVGSYAELTSSVGDHFAFELGCSGGTDTTIGDENVFLELAVGAAASEVVICSGLWVGSASNEAMVGPVPNLSMLDVPIVSGNRVAVRGAGVGTTISAMDVALYGVS